MRAIVYMYNSIFEQHKYYITNRIVSFIRFHNLGIMIRIPALFLDTVKYWQKYGTMKTTYLR